MAIDIHSKLVAVVSAVLGTAVVTALVSTLVPNKVIRDGFFNFRDPKSNVQKLDKKVVKNFEEVIKAKKADVERLRKAIPAGERPTDATEADSYDKAVNAYKAAKAEFETLEALQKGLNNQGNKATEDEDEKAK